LHKYLYADGDPVNKTDPTGRDANAGVLRRPAGGAFGEYTGLVEDIALASVVAVAEVTCAANIQLSVDALKTEGETNVVPSLPTCSAKGECPPCDPPKGTLCSEADWGHPHPKSLGWDPHWHIWQQNQNPQTCKCYWDRKHGPKGARQYEPSDMKDCMEYPSWPNN